MYKFYRMLPSGKWKYSDTYNSTLDPDYHDYINYCNSNNIPWKLVRVYDDKIMFKSEENDNRNSG